MQRTIAVPRSLMHRLFNSPPLEEPHTAKIFCRRLPHPLVVEWPDKYDQLLTLETYDHVGRRPVVTALNRSEALALADALRRAACS